MIIEILKSKTSIDEKTLKFRFLERAEIEDNLKIYHIIDYSMHMNIFMTPAINSILRDEFNVIEILNTTSGLWARYMICDELFFQNHIISKYDNEYIFELKEQGARELLKIYNDYKKKEL
mgnify:CR=1 FL=1